MEYKLKLQQLVSFSRCRIYRKFIRSIAADSNIRLNGDYVLKALAGIDADVTSIADDCIYTINGMNVVMNNAEGTAECYSLTHEDYELTKLRRRKIRYTDLLEVKVNLNTDHHVKAELRCFTSKDKDIGSTLCAVCHLLTRPNENPELDIDQDFLLERVLRKHPNVIGVGEICAAAECMSVAEASRTGHTCLTTIHSNSAESSYKRMMTLAKRKFQMADEILMQIMVEAFPIIVYTKQLDDGSRKIMEIIEGEDFVKGKTVTRTLFRICDLCNPLLETVTGL